MIYLNKESKNTGKFNIFATILALLMAVILCCACTVPPTDGQYEPNTEFPSEFKGFIRGRKIYVTSIGQSVEFVNLMRNMDTVEGLDYEENVLLNANEVEHGSVVFIVVGCSIKSLAESGLTKESEKLRSQNFVAAAERGEFDLICWHIGGVARRGSTSDTLIEYLFGNCSLALFKAEGNADMKLSDWAKAGGTPYCQFESNIVNMLRLLVGEDND